METLIALLVSAVITIIAVVASLLITAVSILVPVIVMLVVAYILVKQLQSGDAVLMVSSPVAQAIAASQKPAGPRRMKKVQCPSCGASKLTTPKTAWLYCDYCGSLVDWDFKIACQSSGSARPGPAYERILKTEAPRQNAALAQGDQDAYRESTKRVFVSHMNACKASYSPRLGDPDYRKHVLDFTVETYTKAAFDEEAKKLEAVMSAEVAKLQWTGGFGSPRRVELQGFLAMLRAFRAHQSRWFEVNGDLMENHPDGASRSLLESIAGSAFAQGWMPYLDKAGQDEMIGLLGLGGEYIDPKPFESTERHCGGCAAPLMVVEGAKKVLCEGCGRTNDVEQGEVQCTGCGTPLCLPVGKPRFQCPSCEAEIRVEGTALSPSISF